MFWCWTTVPLGWLSKSMALLTNGHSFRCFTWLSTLCKKRTEKSKNLWRVNIMLISARGIFYHLKLCLISPNPFHMNSHGSWDKEASSQNCLLALYEPSWTLQSPLHSLWRSPLGLQPSPFYLSASLLLLYFRNISSFPLDLLGSTQTSGLQLEFYFLRKHFQIPEKLYLLWQR